MARDHFSAIEISSVVFLTIFTLLLIPSVFIWIKYIRAGYPWRYGFWGAFFLCIARLACFISELIFYSSSYTNRGAAIAYIVTLSLGFVGLLECEAALFVSWAETHIEFNPTQEQIHGKIRLLNLVAMVLLIYGSSNVDASGGYSGSAAACIQAGTILLMVLTFAQAAFILFGWSTYARMSNTLAILSVSVMALLTRIIFSVYSTFHRGVSIITFRDSNVKYLVGATLFPEVLALILLVIVGLVNVKNKNFRPPTKKDKNAPEAYETVPLDQRKQEQGVAERV